MTVGQAYSQSVSELLRKESTRQWSSTQVVVINNLFTSMNAKVRRYQPMFLSPQHHFHHKSPSKASDWKSKINHQVTLCYNRLQRNSQPQAQPLTQQKSTNQCRLKSCSTQSNTFTSLTRKHLDLSNPNLSTTLFLTSRQRQLQSLYSHRIQLLQQQCLYLRTNFITHCLRYHRPQFQRLSDY